MDGQKRKQTTEGAPEKVSAVNALVLGKPAPAPLDTLEARLDLIEGRLDTIETTVAVFMGGRKVGASFFLRLFRRMGLF